MMESLSRIANAKLLFRAMSCETAPWIGIRQPDIRIGYFHFKVKAARSDKPVRLSNSWLSGE